MTRALTIIITATVVVAVLPAAADAGTVAESLAEIRAVAGGELSVVTADGQTTLRFATGRLTATPSADVRSAGARFLERHAAALGASGGTSVHPERDVPLATGVVLRYRQRIAGIPVVGGEVALRFDRWGILRTAVSGMRPLARIAPAVPRVGSAVAVAKVLAMPDVVAPADPGASWVGLVYYLAGDEARLAWQVEAGAVPAFGANWVAWIDAHTGEVLARRNRIFHDRQARVFPENPVSTPDIVQVTLDDLPPWTADPYHLTNDLILARNCPDLHELFPVSFGGFTINAHLCSEVQVAVGDENRDFLYYDNSDTAQEDLFAEATMFHQVSRVYDFFQGFGFVALREQPLACTVNFRIPIDIASGGYDLANITNRNGTLYPFDNAFFLPAGSAATYIARDRDSIVFGQGTAADFAYDGDVVYHEFGHAVVDSTSGLEAATIDDQGVDVGPGALNEGYSDIFAAFLTDDPMMGEYAGGTLSPSGAIRNLDNEHRCPEHLVGQVHEDSLPWTGAAWDIYQALGAAVMQPYYDAMASLIPSADFALASRATVAEIGRQIGADAAATAQAVLDARNLVDCERVLVGGGGPKLLLMGEGTDAIGLTPYVPGYAMFRIAVPAGQTQILVRFRASVGGTGGVMGGEIRPHVLFRPGPDRLRFTYRGTRVTGNETYAVDAVRGTGADYEAVYCEADGALDPGDYYAMIANTGGASMQMTGISVRYNNSPPEGPCAGGGDAGEGGEDVVEDAPEEAADEADGAPEGGDDRCDPPSRCEETCRARGLGAGICTDTPSGPRCSCSPGGGDGCGCRAAGAPGGMGGVFLIAAAAAIGRFRRRSRR